MWYFPLFGDAGLTFPARQSLQGTTWSPIIIDSSRTIRFSENFSGILSKKRNWFLDANGTSRRWDLNILPEREALRVSTPDLHSRVNLPFLQRRPQLYRPHRRLPHSLVQRFQLRGLLSHHRNRTAILTGKSSLKPTVSSIWRSKSYTILLSVHSTASVENGAFPSVAWTISLLISPEPVTPLSLAVP